MALDEMRDVAQSGIEFARQKLSIEQRAYLAALPLTFASGSCQFVHASLNAPSEWHYVMRESEARAHFMVQTEPLCFCGHTHAPIVWHLSNTGNIKSWRGKGGLNYLRAGGRSSTSAPWASRAISAPKRATRSAIHKPGGSSFAESLTTSPKRGEKSCVRSCHVSPLNGCLSGDENNTAALRWPLFSRDEQARLFAVNAPTPRRNTPGSRSRRVRQNPPSATPATDRWPGRIAAWPRRCHGRRARHCG